MAQYIDVSHDAYDRLSEIAPTVTTSPDHPDFGMLDLDVLVWNTGSSEGASDRIRVIPTYQALNVAKDGRDVFVDDPIVSGAMTWGTVLSLPFAIDALVPRLSVAASR
ncbi:hypothetical protein [Rhodococcoides kyotonense]|uniref:Iron complex transport system substrate-binding protein n=1 Tax=Rhodococcoides kyotonense TaxID=398843 RepID=A0A239GN78_9NOCA|nr:hypothetical protein [Rhodococcus kyotonensis]SNS70325.1 iron complex transport system substrate-binding protein [Rhodococcus kyotonensis]